jgi:apoptotic protease-activating factor
MLFQQLLFFFLGSPLLVSLIGALLRDFPNRWEYYLRQLQNKQFKRIRKSSSYDYEALDEAMSISVEMLRENIKDYYTDLSILQKDVKVPTKVTDGPAVLDVGNL